VETKIHLWSYLAYFFSEWELFQTKVVDKIKTHTFTHFVSINFFSENLTVYEIMWKNFVERGRPQVTIWRIRIACWVPKTTNTHTQVVQYSLLFRCNNGCTKASQCCVICTLAVLLQHSFKLLFLVSFSRVAFTAWVQENVVKQRQMIERMTVFLNMYRSLNGFFLRGYTIETFYTFPFPNACHMSYPSYLPIFNHPTVWYRIQIWRYLLSSFPNSPISF
jgi:hypothetical protein